MGLVSEFRAGRLLQKIMTTDDLGGPQATQALEKLKELGKSAIPHIVQALASADREQREALSGLLATLLDNDSLPAFIQGLSDPNTRIVNAVGEVMQNVGAFDPNRLIIYFAQPNVSEAALVKILEAHKDRLSPQNMLQQAAKLERARQTPAFKLIGEIASEALVPDLISRVTAKDPGVRMHITRILSRFERNDVREVLWKLLNDPQKNVRLAALNGISGMSMPADIRPVIELMKDPDINIQHRAIDAVIAFKHPKTLELLLPILQDESEYVRRAAVEVLNAVASADALKDLLMAIKDRDWWVRERSADALIKIGGPKVVEAMLELIKDKDEYIRRTAIEVINASQDPQAFDQLLDSLEDSDWWVRERAIDALAGMGKKQAAPLLFKALKKDIHTRRAAIRALGTIGDRGAIMEIIPFLRDPESAIQKETIQALTALADEAHAHQIEEAIIDVMEETDGEIRLLAEDAVASIARTAGSRISRITPKAQRASIRSETVSLQPPEIPSQESTQEAPLTDEIYTIDNPNDLKPGILLSGRYKMVKKIGKGAFGTVLLFEDQLVDEPIIMKFINPQFSADKQVSRRFVHEIRYARKITHPNVIRIHDYLSFGETSAISMEYFEGHTLGDELKDNKALTPQYAKDILLQITAGLAAAHKEDVVHRDIKPANILINEAGQVKVVDFGIAAVSGNAETRLTRTGMVIGTPTYLAPEQVLGKPVDNRTDIYSLGIIMYQMLAGHPPYKGDDAMSLMYQHVQGDAKPLKALNPAIPAEFSDIVAKAMATDPNKRYQSMNEVHDHIAALNLE